PNTINIVVTAGDGVTTKTYAVTVTRPASANANLSNLKVNNGTLALTPAFNFNTTSYTLSVTNATTTVKITPAASDANAVIKVNGVAVATGTASPSINLNVGANNVNTVVTAQNGTTAKTYKIVITRTAAGNANLANLKIN